MLAGVRRRNGLLNDRHAVYGKMAGTCSEVIIAADPAIQ